MSVNLYKRPNSKFWYVKYTYKGQLFRRSTKYVNRQKAEAYRDRLIESLILPNTASPEWEAHCLEAYEGRHNWLTLMYSGAKSRSKKRGHHFDLTKSGLYTLVLRSNGKCEVSGTPFGIGPLSMSLDRIDSTKGYSVHNCRIVCCLVNFAMREWGDAVLRTVARNLVAHELISATNSVTYKTPQISADITC